MKYQSADTPISTSGPDASAGRVHRVNMRTVLTVTVISLLFLLPVLVSVEPPPRGCEEARYALFSLHSFRHLMLPGCCLLLFFLNYFIIVPQMLRDLNGWRFIGINFLLTAILTGCAQTAHFFLFTPPGAHPEHPHFSAMSVNFLFRDLLYCLLAIVLAYSLRAYEVRLEASNRRLAADATSRSMELKILRMQLNPHFLFNTLNNIYALISISPQRAQESVMNLGTMLRYLIYESGANFVALRRELEVVENFISLWRLRIESTFNLQTDIDSVTDDVLVPPLVILTLVENAFKHCDRMNPEAFISIRISASDNGTTVADISNSFSPQKEDEKGTKNINSGGIGLANVRQQLDLLYPNGNYRLSITDKEGVFAVVMSLSRPVTPLTQ